MMVHKKVIDNVEKVLTFFLYILVHFYNFVILHIARIRCMMNERDAIFPILFPAASSAFQPNSQSLGKSGPKQSRFLFSPKEFRTLAFSGIDSFFRSWEFGRISN